MPARYRVRHRRDRRRDRQVDKAYRETGAAKLLRADGDESTGVIVLTFSQPVSWAGDLGAVFIDGGNITVDSIEQHNATALKLETTGTLTVNMSIGINEEGNAIVGLEGILAVQNDPLVVLNLI